MSEQIYKTTLLFEWEYKVWVSVSAIMSFQDILLEDIVCK